MIYRCTKTVRITTHSFPLYVEAATMEEAMQLAQKTDFVMQGAEKPAVEVGVRDVLPETNTCQNSPS